MRDRLLAAREAKKLDIFNLSVLALVAFRQSNQAGKQVLESTKLGKLISVDLVTDAGAGGRFLPVAAAKHFMHEISALQNSAIKHSPSGDQSGSGNAGRHKGAAMKDRVKKVLEALRKYDAGRATQFETKLLTVKEDALPDFLGEVTDAFIVASSSTGSANDETQRLATEAMAALSQARQIQSKNLVDSKLNDSKLPGAAVKLVREHMTQADGTTRIVTEADVDAEIKRVREAFASYSSVGKITGSRMSVGLEGQDKVQLAFDRMMGVTESGQNLYAEKNEVATLKYEPGMKGFRSIKESYVFVSGDSDLSFGQGGRGGFMKISEAASLTTDFPNLLLNSLTKKLLQDYAEVGLGGLDTLVSFTDINDFKSQDRVRLGYLGDLSAVAENAGYTDFAKPTDERVTYTATKRGNTLPITRETILNDDLNKISVFPTRIARAARRTLKQFITNFLVNNPNYGPDAIAWFNAGHNNLGSAPLSVDELIAREIKLGLQTEKDSNKPLGLPLTWLCVPFSLKAIAYKINTAQNYNPGVGIQEPNPFYKRFGEKNERIIVNELLDAADTNDWFYGTDASQAPSIEIGFVQGQREPQVFLQNDPTTGAVFTNDAITYKVRHEYGGNVIDFRGIGKNVVP